MFKLLFSGQIFRATAVFLFQKIVPIFILQLKVVWYLYLLSFDFY